MSVLRSLESLVLEAIGNLGFWWLREICEICWTRYLKLCLCLMQACTIISVITIKAQVHFKSNHDKGKEVWKWYYSTLSYKISPTVITHLIVTLHTGTGNCIQHFKNEIVIMNNVIPIYLYTALSMQAWIYNNKCWGRVKRFQGLHSSKKLIPYSKFIYFFKKSAFPTTSKHVKAADKFTHLNNEIVELFQSPNIIFLDRLHAYCVFTIIRKNC